MTSIFDPLGDELARRAPRRMAIFRTRFVIEFDSFVVFAGIEIVHPRPDQINPIHTTCVDLAAAGKGSPEKRDKLMAMAKTQVQRHGVDAIILSATDLALLLESNAEFPCMDCAAVHIDEISERYRLREAGASGRTAYARGPDREGRECDSMFWQEPIAGREKSP